MSGRAASAQVLAVPAVDAAALPSRASLNYPEAFASRLRGRMRRPLGDVFRIKNFGVNLTTLEPGAQSSLHHCHTKQDEFVYVLHGEPTLITDRGELNLRPGMCAGFPADGSAHHIENRSSHSVLILEIGDRAVDDVVDYPDDDLRIYFRKDGTYVFMRKDGTAY